jgi:hypothetical protein
MGSWEAKVAILKTKTRNRLPKSSFGLPGSRKYPMPDAAHAANAKARATQQLNKGALTLEQAQEIRAKATRKMRSAGY